MSIPVHHNQRWLVKIVVRFFKKMEDDAETQIRIHKWFIRFWVINFIAASIVFWFFPEIWLGASIYYVVCISLYANFATDYGALSASQASLSAAKAAERVIPEVLDHE